MIIAIDGPAGSGKTTTARKVAQSLKFTHINTGAMYRGIALKFIRENVNLDDNMSIKRILKNTQFDFSGPHLSILNMDGEDISIEIVSSIVTANVSRISAISDVRIRLVEYQRQMSRGKSVVLDGRDIGTVVFPNADFKFFLIADEEVRAKRRLNDLRKIGELQSIDKVINDIIERDYKDSTRVHSPLKKAESAIIIDTSNLNINEVINKIMNVVNK